MTTHRERVQACLRGEVLDRPPVALWRHFPVDDQSMELLARAHLDFQQHYDFDLLKVTPASSFSVRDWGVEDSWDGNTEGTTIYTKRVIQNPADWERLRIQAPDSPHLARQLQCLRLIRKHLDRETPVLQTIFSPLAQAKHLSGEQVLLSHLRTHPDSVGCGLETIAASTRSFIGAALEVGADGIFYAVQHARAGSLTVEEYALFGMPADKMLLGNASGAWCNILHLHGDDVYFEMVHTYPAQIINWHDRESGPSLEEAGRLWPGSLCGGLRRQTLVFGPADAVKQEASEALSSSVRRRLILSTGCVIPITAPHGNVMAARDAPMREVRPDWHG